MTSFWDTIPRPYFSLAPMADVTDPAYRSLIAECGKPDVTWAEFVSADGLYHTREKKKMADEENPLMRDLLYTEEERPIIAQFFSSNPEMMEYACALAAKLGFDGVALNMGCPDASIEKQGSGAAHIKNPQRAREVIRAAKRGASGLPVSVKTRIGYTRETLDEWLPNILEEDIAELVVHLRTRKEMSAVPAHWELMPRIVTLRDTIAPKTRVAGNGDVKDLDAARQKITETGADGVMLGRAIFGNPWVFAGRKPEDLSREERLDALSKLAERFSQLKPGKSFHILKKHFKAFVSGWDNAAELRAKLMETEDIEGFREVMKGV